MGSAFPFTLLNEVLATEYWRHAGSMKEGPWSYRVISAVAIMPVYSVVLLCIGRFSAQVCAMKRAMVERLFAGTIFGRHAYFKSVVLRMWSRFLPKRWVKAVDGK